MNVKKMCLKVLALLMALTMTVGVGAPVVQATGLLVGTVGAEDVIHYVSLGDSMTNGYAFEGYGQGDLEPGAFVDGGEGIYGHAAYPNQFAEWLEDTYYHGEKTVNHIRLASSALRAEDLLFLLGGREMPRDDWFGEVNHYTGEDDNIRLSAHYRESIAQADIITLGIGNASFGAYMVQYLTRALGVMGGHLDDEEIMTLEDALVLLEDEAERQVVRDIYSDMKESLLASIPAKEAEQYRVGLLCDAAAYITAGFLLNYKGVVEKIVEINPDAEIILVGLMNTAYGMEVTAEGMEPIAIGDIMDGVFGLLNAYVAGIPALMKAEGTCGEATFYYATQPHPKFIVQVFDDLAASGWKNIDCGAADCGTAGHDCGSNGRLSADVVRTRSIEAYNDGLRYMIGAAMGMSLPAITVADVQAYTGNYSGYDQAVIDRDISTAIYLAIEDAVVASVDTMELPLDGLASIAGDLSGVFTDMPAALDPANNPTPAIIREALGQHLTSTATLRGMCKVYGFFKIGNGMSVHPTPAGHDELFTAVKTAYVQGHTAEDETLANVIEALKAAGLVVADRYEEIITRGYAYAVEMGYADEIREAVTAAIAAIGALDLDWIDASPALKAALEAELAELKARLDAVMARGEFSISDLRDVIDEAYTMVEHIRQILVAYADGALLGEYVVSEDSYYVAITGASSAYADKLAEALGVSYGKQTWGALNFDELARADLITIGYDEGELNRFALNQVLGYGKMYLDTEIRSSATAYAHTVAEKLFGNMLTDEAVATVPAAVDNTISELLTHPLLADKTLETVDWTALVGEENLPRVERLRAEIRAKLLGVGIPATVPVHVDVVEYLFGNASNFGESVTKLLDKIDRKKVEDKLGADAIYTIQVPTIDFVMMAVEAELYSSISFHKYYAETVLTLKAVNPDAAVAVLGHYNPFDGLVVSMSGATLDLGVIYDVIKDASSAHSFAYAMTAGVTYVDISDVETAYESTAPEGEADLMGFVAAYLADPAVAQPSDAGHAYIRDQILNAYTITCAHSWTDATCTEAKTCSRCGETEGEALGHVWADATCTIAKTCSVCGETEGEASGHVWTDATCTEAKTCATCGETEGEAIGHVWTDATCTVAKTCSTCGAAEGDANGHTEETIPAVPATCTEDGLTEGKKCSACGEILAAQTTIPAVGHTEEEIPGVEATCDEEGLEMGTKCSVCGEILLAQVTIPALGHNLTEATCTKAPYCTVCGEISEGMPTEHTWTEATCEKPATCTACGATEGELAAHTYGEWTVVTEATKKAEGKQERTCTVCGHVESEAIPQLEGCASVLSTLTVICVTLASAAVVIRKRDEE